MFIVEHPTKGTFLEYDYSERKAKLRWSGSRADPEYAKQFRTVGEALYCLLYEAPEGCLIRDSKNDYRPAAVRKADLTVALEIFRRQPSYIRKAIKR